MPTTPFTNRIEVVGPPTNLGEDRNKLTGGTRAATAIISHTAYLVHDELEIAYGREFVDINSHHRAVLLKAIVTAGQVIHMIL